MKYLLPVLVFIFALAATSCNVSWSPAPTTSSTTATSTSTAVAPSCNCSVNIETKQTTSCVCPDDQVKWTYAEDVRNAVTGTMMAHGPGKDLCPKYDTLSLPWKLEAWVAVLGGIAWTESTWSLNPTPFREPNLPVDTVTHLPTYSEGLYQLSYGDKPNYAKQSWCQKIDYAKKNLVDKDINIGCTMGIMGVLLDNGRGIRAYWSSARVENKYFPKTTGKIRELYKGCGV